jgi:hypothetical protein
MRLARHADTPTCPYADPLPLWRPFSISNPADRVFFVERTFMCLVRARRRGTVFPGLKPRAEPSRPLRGEEASQILINLAPFNPG